MHSDLKDKFLFAQTQGLSMVAWRMPDEIDLHHFEPCQEHNWQGESEEKTGFIFAPFSDESPAFCIGISGNVASNHQAPKAPKTYDALHYKTIVGNAVAEIQTGVLDKVVAARAIEIKDAQFDAFTHFLELMDAHPNAFCYLWFSPSTGVWMGASPELLLERKGGRIRTMALAGTRANDQDDFGSKELEEQDLVLNYLKETLNPYINGLEITQKTKVNSGHLTHLKNELNGELTDRMESIYPLIKALHPTPAIAGLPKAMAIDFIKRQEGFSRSYYSGYLGLHSNRESSLFVNLRCMQVLGQKQYIYVGAGLTHQSNPEAEWLETEEKARIVRLT